MYGSFRVNTVSAIIMIVNQGSTLLLTMDGMEFCLYFCLVLVGYIVYWGLNECPKSILLLSGALRIYGSFRVNTVSAIIMIVNPRISFSVKYRWNGILSVFLFSSSGLYCLLGVDLVMRYLGLLLLIMYFLYIYMLLLHLLVRCDLYIFFYL
jgi:hypothetical protein